MTFPPGMPVHVRRAIEASANAAKLLTAVGMEVTLLLDDGSSVHTKLASLPWQLGHGAWVARVEGKSGGWCCSRIIPTWTATDSPIHRHYAGLAGFTKTKEIE